MTDRPVVGSRWRRRVRRGPGSPVGRVATALWSDEIDVGYRYDGAPRVTALPVARFLQEFAALTPDAEPAHSRRHGQ